MRDVGSKLALAALPVAGTIVAMFIGEVEKSFPQVGTSASLGYINDSSGAATPGAKVTLIDPAMGIERALQSGTAGRFKLADLLRGTYTLPVTLQGFAAHRAEESVLQVDLGEIDVSQLRPFGTPAEARRVVREAIHDVGVTAHRWLGSTTEIHPAVKLENVLAMWEEIETYG
jgi:hypothetical protein